MEYNNTINSINVKSKRSGKSLSDLTYIQINYVEMRRQTDRIKELSDDVCSKLNGAIAAINNLASLVGASVNLSIESASRVSRKADEIIAFVNEQIGSYEQLNEEILANIKDLEYFVFLVNKSEGTERAEYNEILKQKQDEENGKKIKEIVEAAGFTYCPEMGKYNDLTFNSVEEKMEAFDNFIYTKAMEAGLTDKEAKMAIVISRWETGNYSKEVKGSSAYNYILPSNNNICGAKGGSGEWANLEHDRNGFNVYDTIDQSAEHYMDFLKGGYFNQGLTSFTKMQPKYCPIDDPSDTKGVNNYWLGGCQSLYYQLFGEWTD